MIRLDRYVLGGVLMIALAACQQSVTTPAAPAVQGGRVTEAEADKIADETLATWLTMDAKKIDALYAADVVGFDVSAPPLTVDRAGWTKINDAFAAMKFDKATVTARKTQLVGVDAFVFSSVSNMTSAAGPMKAVTIRCTDIFRKQADGKYLIVNEHCSTTAKPA